MILNFLTIELTKTNFSISFITQEDIGKSLFSFKIYFIPVMYETRYFEIDLELFGKSFSWAN